MLQLLRVVNGMKSVECRNGAKMYVRDAETDQYKATVPNFYDRETTHLESVNSLAIRVQVVHQMHLDG